MDSNTPAEQTVSAYFIVKDAASALDFYARAFGAEEVFRLTDPSGRIGHAQIRLGDSLMMLADEHPDFGAVSALTFGGSPVRFHLSVSDANASTQRAVEAGATLIRPVQDQFYGLRSGMVADPFGYEWFIGQPVEQVSPEEMQHRFTQALEG